MDYTWTQIGFAVGATVSFIAGLVGAAKFVADRLDIKLSRKEAGQGASDDRLFKFIDLQKMEIAELKVDLQNANNANQLSRPTVNNVYIKIRDLEKILSSLAIHPCPDEVANILNRRMGQAKEKLAELRDLLP